MKNARTMLMAAALVAAPATAGAQVTNHVSWQMGFAAGGYPAWHSPGIGLAYQPLALGTGFGFGFGLGSERIGRTFRAESGGHYRVGRTRHPAQEDRREQEEYGGRGREEPPLGEHEGLVDEGPVAEGPPPHPAREPEEDE